MGRKPSLTRQDLLHPSSLCFPQVGFVGGTNGGAKHSVSVQQRDEAEHMVRSGPDNDPPSPRLAILCLLLALVAVVGFKVSLGVPVAPADRPENPYFEFNDWINSFFFRPAVKEAALARFGKEGTHYLLTYIRDLVSGSILYYVTAGLWHLYIYRYKGEQFFKASIAVDLRGPIRS